MNKQVVLFGRFVGVALLFSLVAHATAQVPGPAISTEAIITIGACKFTIANMFGGKFMVLHPEQTPPQQGVYDLPDTGPHASSVIGTFGLFCVDANDEGIGAMLNAKQVDGKWLMYNPWPSPNEPELTSFDPGAHPQTVQFTGGNWTGTGLTVDETSGDEKHRARMFYFCLVHQTHALCGKSPVQWLADTGEHNELWKIRAILQSVKFVDASPLLESDPAIGSASAPSNRGNDD
ncbi:hypothetical protein C7410_106130 [Paraburkholderia silvatlantica]|uniref:Uncharacterized protein n=1 Tax=Paraburkholderia silvatlantica TaxID=321895 RepID=A0A2V4U7Y2_9BURK|nr:hypothetical protein [Paraburkholderia silvatlantica]PYE24300.1 hypothetical protein C7410_106130 [Paraburkholderia silvatlantica]